MTLLRKLRKLELLAHTQPTPAVWFEDISDQPSTMVCHATGERRPLADAVTLGAGNILVRYVEDWRGPA